MTQVPMYSSILSGPQTTLTDEYTSGIDETIHVATLDVFPVVSGEENYVLVVSPDGSAAVTLSYTAMQSTATEFILDITGVIDSYPTGALQGYNFPVGSLVSRPILPADIEAIKSNLGDILAQVQEIQTDGAPKLETARAIDGVLFDGTKVVSHYAVCSTTAGTAAKTVNLNNFTLTTGARIIVQFANANRKANPTLNVSGTGAAPIYWRGAPVDATALNASTVYEMVYTGAEWAIVGNIIPVDTKPEIHGFLLDNADSNPETRITYVGASANLTAEERMALYTQHNRHCIMKGAKVVGLCDESDWSKFEDGTDSGLASGYSLDGNFCLRHDTLWWRVTLYTPDIGLIEFTWDDPHDDSFVTAHGFGETIRTELFTGAFEGTSSTVGTTANCFRSVYGTDDTYKPTVSINNEAAYQRARNTGTAEGLSGEDNTYSSEQLITYAMWFIQQLWTYGTTDFQTDVARGIVDDTSTAIGLRACGYGMSLTGGMTQGTPASSQAYTDNVAAVYGGRVNPHGNEFEHKADCVYHYGKMAMAVKGGDHVDITTVTAENWDEKIPDSWHIVEGIGLTSGYVKAIVFDTYCILLSKTNGGAATTYMADYTYRNEADTSEDVAAARCCLVGGVWHYGSYAGPACVSVTYAVGYSSGSVGARLQAHGLTIVGQ